MSNEEDLFPTENQAALSEVHISASKWWPHCLNEVRNHLPLTFGEQWGSVCDKRKTLLLHSLGVHRGTKERCPSCLHAEVNRLLGSMGICDPSVNSQDLGTKLIPSLYDIVVMVTWDGGEAGRMRKYFFLASFIPKPAHWVISRYRQVEREGPTSLFPHQSFREMHFLLIHSPSQFWSIFEKLCARILKLFKQIQTFPQHLG